MSHTDEIAQISEVERVALDLASSVFGWQHLARYSGMSADWLDLTLLGIVRSALTAFERDADLIIPPAEPASVKQCGWCSELGHTTDEHNSARPDDLRFPPGKRPGGDDE